MESLLTFNGCGLRPILDRVFVLPSTAEEQTTSGLIIPESARESRTGQGRVVAVGPGWKDLEGDRLPMECHVGDLVCFNKHTGVPCAIDGVEYLVMKDCDVEIIVEP